MTTTLLGPNPQAAEQVLETAIRRLSARFVREFSREMIDRYVHESYQALYSTAEVKTFVPLQATRFAADRLEALAQATGMVGKVLPEVLFVCTRNAGWSQMTAALLERAAHGRVHVRSAGSLPAGALDPAVVEALAEVGLDLSQEFPKPLTDDVVRAADVVVTMGCGDPCPLYPRKRYRDWGLQPDPVGQPLEVVRSIRDEIDWRVTQLVDELAPVF